MLNRVARRLFVVGQSHRGQWRTWPIALQQHCATDAKSHKASFSGCSLTRRLRLPMMSGVEGAAVLIG
jgi:hypothetical protein